MKVLNYKLCSSGIKEEKIQNKNKAMELGLPFKEGLILEIKRLSLTRSSEGEEQGERILSRQEIQFGQFRKDVLKYWMG